jgi:anti-sigma factor RsiW
MVTCQEFKQWLIDQDSAGENASRQMADHVRVCQTCEGLYQTDRVLETMLKNGMQTVEPTPGLIERARRKIESEPKPQPVSFFGISWKTMAPALTMAALVVVILFNPFSASLQTVDDVVTHSIANHLDAGMQMTFEAGEVVDIDQWFTRRLGYAVRLPDLKQLGLSLVGGRKCALGKITAALLFCKSKGKRASLFVIDPSDVAFGLDDKRKYIVEQGNHKVTLWKDSGVVYATVI